MPVVSASVMPCTPSSRYASTMASTRFSSIVPSNGQPKAVATVPFSVTGEPLTTLTSVTISPKPVSERSQLIRMFARLCVWLADITRFSSSARAAIARPAPFTFGINAT
ncbi:hypothetical protein B0G77_4548 [Paraburkholderia sp. BL10I2N1]|nr:hypothetical protein B0G77_4548 [Paraburkholderia sp. BL10I2N1]